MTSETLRALALMCEDGCYELVPMAAAAYLHELRVVDLRDPRDYNDALGHIPGAERWTIDEAVSAAGEWEPETPVLLVCRSGSRSTVAAKKLVTAGFSEAYRLAGGMLAWVSNGLPCSRSGNGQRSSATSKP